MTRGRPAIPRLVAGLVLAACLALVTGPAAARDAGLDSALDTGLEVSRSKSGPYADQLPGPLLQGVGRVVPLDEAAGTFWVRNGSPAPARTTVAVVNRGPVNDFTGSLTVVMGVAGTVTTGTLPPGGRRCDLVATGPELEPGGVQPVEVALLVGDMTEQWGMDEQVALDVDVTMTEVAGSGEVAVCGEQAAAQPADADPDLDADCERRTVVTLTGAPRCVPTAVDAGQRDTLGLPRDPAAVAGTGVTVLLLGGLLLLAVRRRRGAVPARHRG